MSLICTSVLLIVDTHTFLNLFYTTSLYCIYVFESINVSALKINSVVRGEVVYLGTPRIEVCRMAWV